MHIRAIDFSVLLFWNIAFAYNIKYEMFKGIATVNDVVNYNFANQFFSSIKSHSMNISVWYVVYTLEVTFPNTWIISSARALGPAIDVANFDDTKFYLFGFWHKKEAVLINIELIFQVFKIRNMILIMNSSPNWHYIIHSIVHL